MMGLRRRLSQLDEALARSQPCLHLIPPRVELIKQRRVLNVSAAELQKGKAVRQPKGAKFLILADQGRAAILRSPCNLNVLNSPMHKLSDMIGLVSPALAASRKAQAAVARPRGISFSGYGHRMVGGGGGVTQGGTDVFGADIGEVAHDLLLCRARGKRLKNVGDLHARPRDRRPAAADRRINRYSRVSGERHASVIHHKRNEITFPLASHLTRISALNTNRCPSKRSDQQLALAVVWSAGLCSN